VDPHGTGLSLVAEREADIIARNRIIDGSGISIEQLVDPEIIAGPLFSVERNSELSF